MDIELIRSVTGAVDARRAAPIVGTGRGATDLLATAAAGRGSRTVGVAAPVAAAEAAVSAAFAELLRAVRAVRPVDGAPDLAGPAETDDDES